MKPHPHSGWHQEPLHGVVASDAVYGFQYPTYDYRGTLHEFRFVSAATWFAWDGQRLAMGKDEAVAA